MVKQIQQVYIVQQSDVGKMSGHKVTTECKCCGHKQDTYPFEPLGRVQKIDVGKMLYLIGSIWYAENDQQMKKRLGNNLTYTTDGKCFVYAGKTVIAKSYVGNDGYEVRILQGMDRLETMAKIRRDCPEFIKANNIPEIYTPKLFARSKS